MRIRRAGVPRRMIRTGGVRSQHLRPGGDVRVVVTFCFVLFENVLQLHHEVRNDVAAQIF